MKLSRKTTLPVNSAAGTAIAWSENATPGPPSSPTFYRHATPVAADPMTRVRNDLFDPSHGLDRGRPFIVEAVWYLTKCLLFLTPLPAPCRLKCQVLRWF